MADILPNFKSVYEKWEKHQPFSGFSSPSSNGCVTSNIPGRDAWVAKFGTNLQMPDRRRRRREKPTSLPSFPEMTTLGDFKVTPTIMPENKHRRPFMGRACAQCVPHSRSNVYDDVMPRCGIRDLLHVPTETSDNNILVRSFCHLVYTMRRDVSHRYPDMSLAVLTNQRVAEAIRKTALEEIADEESDTKKFVRAMKASNNKACKLLKKMKAGISNIMIRFTGWFLIKALSCLLMSVQVHDGQMMMVKQTSESKLPLIYLPMHKSHLDYILLTFILYNYDIRAPHVAAGDNLDIPFFSWLMRGLGGFFIRRRLDLGNGKKDVIYRAVLQVYMQELLRSGQSLEFFIEGGRSRTGKAIKPKGGLLSVVVESVSSGLVPDVYIVPVSISYEKLLDGDFKREQLGHPKSKESFWKAVKGLWRVFRSRFGSVRVDFAQPFSLQEYLQWYQASTNRRSISPPNSATPKGHSPPAEIGVVKLRGSTSSLYGTDVVIEDQREMVNKLADHSIYNSVHCQAIMSTHLLAFLLLFKFRQGVELKELVSACHWMKEEINIRGRDVGFVGTMEDVIQYACELLEEHLVVTTKDQKPNGTVEKTQTVEIRPSLELSNLLQLSYYSNNAVSVFVLESVIALSICATCNIELANSNLLKGRDIEVSKQKVINKAVWLCELLHYEFTFTPPCATLEQELSEALERFVISDILCFEEEPTTDMGRDRHWAKRISKTVSWDEGDSEDDDDYGAPDVVYQLNTESDEAMNRLQFLRDVVSPFVESYWIVCCQLTKLLEGDMPESDLLHEAQKLAIERVENNIASFAESAAHESIKNGLRALEHMNAVNLYVAADIKMLTLTDAFQTKDRIMDFMSLLEEFTL